MKPGKTHNMYLLINTHITLSHQSLSATFTDKGISVMNKVISGIRVIKMYAWENAFRDLVTKLCK